MKHKTTIQAFTGETVPFEFEDRGEVNGQYESVFMIEGTKFTSRVKFSEAGKRLKADYDLIRSNGYDPNTIDFGALNERH